MSETGLNEEKIREVLKNYCDDPMQCGLEIFVVKKDFPRLKRISLSEKENEEGKNFRTVLKEMLFEILEEKFLSQESEYADGHRLADNQNKILIFEQGDSFHPFTFVSDNSEIDEFMTEDLNDATGLMFCIRKETNVLWLYQHLWSIMVPNKKKSSPMARIMHFENRIVFEEQRESLLTIAKKIDIIIINNYLLTSNIVLLQKRFSFHDYIYQTAQQTIQCIEQKNLVENTDKLTEYIRRGNPKYARKMMRIGVSKVFGLTQEELINKINTLSRWQGKFNFNQDSNQIVLNTYSEVESLIDLFDERYTRSDVTDTEYDTDVKSVAGPT